MRSTERWSVDDERSEEARLAINIAHKRLCLFSCIGYNPVADLGKYVYPCGFSGFDPKMSQLTNLRGYVVNRNALYSYSGPLTPLLPITGTMQPLYGSDGVCDAILTSNLFAQFSSVRSDRWILHCLAQSVG